MAGAGYKLFNTGDVLTAAQVNTYLNEQTVMVFASSAARTSALSGVLAEGMMSYLQDTNSVEVYNGSAWTAVGGGGLTSPLTTKGDVWGYSTTNARIPVGTNGTVLTADSGETLGVKWAAPTAGAFKGVFLRQSAGQTIANATDTTLLFDTEAFDTDGFHSTVTNTGRITIPAGLGGYYLVIIHTSFTANATGIREAYLQTSLGPFYIDTFASTVGSGSRATLSSSVILNLSATNYVETICRQTSGGNLDTISGTGGTTLSAVYLGA